MGVDIGFNTLILVILFITPGIVFRRFYFQGEFTKQFKFQNLTLSLVFSLFIGIVIQIISFSLYQYQIEIFVLDFLSTEASFISEVRNIHSRLLVLDTMYVLNNIGLFYQIIAFVFYSYFVAFVCSVFLWSFVRLAKLDRTFKIFRFNNHWNYYFKGEIKDFSEFKHLDKGKVLYTKADIILQTNSGERKMYSGILSQYTINSTTNKLENIYLTNVKKWKLITNDETEKAKMQPVEFNSDCLILDYKNIFNINLNYIYKENTKTSFYTPIVFLLTTMFIVISKHEYLYSESLIYTIITKFSVCIFVLWLLVLIEFIFGKNKKDGNRINAITGTITLMILHTVIHLIFASLL